MLRALRPMTRSFLCLVALVCAACQPLQRPPTREVVHLFGTPYERGFQHGEKLKSKIHSFYATLLTNSLFPYLGREQPDIASFLPEYQAERYQNGNFAFELLLDSAKSIEKTLPRATRDELRGVSEGSGLSYDQTLVLNTFVDSTLAVRGIALAIRLGRAPQLERVEALGAGSDGVDNDADGTTDEVDEGVIAPWIPELRASWVELAPSTQFKLTLKDPDGINPDTLRVSLGSTLYRAGDAGLTITPVAADTLEVLLAPQGGLPAASALTLVLSAGDDKLLETPAPVHNSFMRDEEVVFTTRGSGLAPNRVLRPELTDGRTRPPPVSIAVRGAATRDGAPLLGQHFALLDANTAHKHGVVFVHHPDTGPEFAVVGWAGVTWGLAGLSTRGVAYACNPADTLDNTVVGSVLDQVADLSKAKLVATGTPIGVAGRRVLETTTSAQGAVDLMKTIDHVYGWACTYADQDGQLAAAETDGDIFTDGQNGVFPVEPGTLDARGDRLSSLRGDDLVQGSSYALNYPDIITLTLAGQRVVPQRRWSGFFLRSRRAVDAAFRQLETDYGQVDVASMESLLGSEQLVDRSDSMNAVVLEPRGLKVHSAMGQVPATDGPWETVDLTEEVTR
jgi:Acyl-coenzyme A:6-aminopenicillanic acid acyl-transferase